MNKQNRYQKSFLGMPVSWDARNPFRPVWNKNDDKLFPPKAFGIGWTINFHAVLRKIGLLEGGRKNRS